MRTRDCAPRAWPRRHVGMDGPVEDVAFPNGTIWNMVYDRNAPAGTLPSISHEELWRRLQRFLEDVIPVAEQSGVQLAAHPDDPPMPTMRRQPRLVYQPHMYQRLIDLAPSRSNALELCVGTLAEMTEGNIYDAVDQYSKQGKDCLYSSAQCRGEGTTLSRNVH